MLEKCRTSDWIHIAFGGLLNGAVRKSGNGCAPLASTEQPLLYRNRDLDGGRLRQVS